MLKEELEAIIKPDNVWSDRSTLILAIGILGEYVALPFFEDAKVSLAAFLFRSRRPVDLKASIKQIGKKLKLAFAFMVLAGIVGEYAFSSRIARNADRLKQIADQDLTDATGTASDAIDEASATARENIRLGTAPAKTTRSYRA